MCARRVTDAGLRISRLWTKSEQGREAGSVLALSLFSLPYSLFVGVGKREEDAAGVVGGADAALGGVIVVWHWRVGWTGMGQPFGGLLGKGDNNKAARVRVSARARAQGPGRGNGQAYLPRHPVPPPSGSTRYLSILTALLPWCCCCQSCLHPCLVTEDCWVARLLPTLEGALFLADVLAGVLAGGMVQQLRGTSVPLSGRQNSTGSCVGLDEDIISADPFELGLKWPSREQDQRARAWIPGSGF